MRLYKGVSWHHRTCMVFPWSGHPGGECDCGAAVPIRRPIVANPFPNVPGEVQRAVAMAIGLHEVTRYGQTKPLTNAVLSALEQTVEEWRP